MQDKILSQLKTKKMSIEALYQALSLRTAEEYKELAKTLNQMEEAYLINLAADFKYRALSPTKLFKGTLDLKQKG